MPPNDPSLLFPAISTRDPTAHAEIVAIRSACASLASYWLDGCEIYTSCEPCPMCLSAMYWAHISRYTYAATRQDAAAIGFDDSRIYAEISLPPSMRSLGCAQAFREEALEVFEAWMQKPDRLAY